VASAPQHSPAFVRPYGPDGSSLSWGGAAAHPQTPLRFARMNRAPLRACCLLRALRRTPQTPLRFARMNRAPPEPAACCGCCGAPPRPPLRFARMNRAPLRACCLLRVLRRTPRPPDPGWVARDSMTAMSKPRRSDGQVSAANAGVSRWRGLRGAAGLQSAAGPPPPALRGAPRTRGALDAVDGRLLVVVAPVGSEGEPRFGVDWGIETAQVFGTDVEALGPAARSSWTRLRPATRSDRSTRSRRQVLGAGGPEPLRNGSPKRRARSEAALDDGEGQQWNRSPGNLLSKPKTVEITKDSVVMLTCPRSSRRSRRRRTRSTCATSGCRADC